MGCARWQACVGNEAHAIPQQIVKHGGWTLTTLQHTPGPRAPCIRTQAGRHSRCAEADQYVSAKGAVHQHIYDVDGINSWQAIADLHGHRPRVVQHDGHDQDIPTVVCDLLCDHVYHALGQQMQTTWRILGYGHNATYNHAKDDPGIAPIRATQRALH